MRRALPFSRIGLDPRSVLRQPCVGGGNWPVARRAATGHDRVVAQGLGACLPVLARAVRVLQPGDEAA